MEILTRERKRQYVDDLIYLSGGAPKWEGSLMSFIGDSVGFIINYVGESGKTPQQAREAVINLERSLQEWRDYQPKSAADIKILPISKNIVASSREVND